MPDEPSTGHGEPWPPPDWPPPPRPAPPTAPPPWSDTPPGAGHGDDGRRPRGPLDPLGRPLAAWAKRVLAFLLDAVVAGLLGGVITLVVTRPDVRPLSGGGYDIHWRAGNLFAAVALLYLVNTAYFTFLTGSRRGQTLGAMTMGIAVRDAASGGQLGAARGLVRSLIVSAFLVPYLLLPWVLDMLWPLWDPGRQAVHDKAARSVVVDLR
ncbi:MAG TPA: RDD family protein [Acidimicrobiales bacterium]|nr:RDD family protein [Acidimicrobiales bacterium]